MDAQVVEGTLDQRIAVLAHADYGIVDRAGLVRSRCFANADREAGQGRAADPAASRGVRGGTPPSDAARPLARRGPRARRGRGAEPRARRGVVESARPARRPRARDHRAGRTRAARRPDLASQPQPRPGTRHAARADPGDQRRPHPERPRRHARGGRARPRRGGGGVAAAPRRPQRARRRGGTPRRGTARRSPRRRAGSHPQRLRGGDGRPLPATQDRAAADERRRARAPRRLSLAGAPRRRRARQLALPQHPCSVRARPGARRRPAGPRLRDPPLHLRAGDSPRAVGRLPAQAGTRVTFSAWIFFCAPVRRASGSGASAPCSSSASR